MAALIAGYSNEVIEDAIALQDGQPHRQRLRQWLDIVRDTQLLRSITAWGQAALPQERLDAAWELLDADEQNRLQALAEAHWQATEQPVEHQWGISREQAEEWGAKFEWIKGGIVRVAYAALDFVRLATGEFVSYSELRLVQ
jgi:hypothetical protein